MRSHRRYRFLRVLALVLGVAAIAISAVGPSAAAEVTEPAVEATAAKIAVNALAQSPAADSVPEIRKYLRYIGVDPRKLVIQRGAKNYAGPSCPGTEWRCTQATGVVFQVSQTGQNTFECSPEEDQEHSTEAPDTCVIFQSSTDGKNQATCRETSDANPAALTCDITQFNDTGDNLATIDQNVRQSGGADQEAQLTAELFQDNDAGNNHAHVTQTVTQSTSDVASGLQSQTANFDADVFQDTDSGGNNFLQQSQALVQTGRASGPSSIAQTQLADHFGEVDQDVEEDEESFLSLRGVGLAATDEGFSKAHVTQTERQTLTGPGSQVQDGPMDCCGAESQTGSPAQTLLTLHQSSTQNASQFDDEDAVQDQFLHGDCFTSGTCTIHQQATNEADSLSQKVSGTGFQELFTTCFAGPGEGEPFGECFAGGE